MVYTWVNGSDPQHIENLKKYKQKHINSSLQYVKLEFEEYFNMALPEKSANKTTNELFKPCFHSYCMQIYNLIIVEPQFEQSDGQFFLTNAKNIFKEIYSNITIEDIEYPNTHHSNISIIYINNVQFKINTTILSQLNDLLKRINLNARIFSRKNKQKITSYRFYMGFYALDCNISPNCIENVKHTFIVNSDLNGKFF